MTNSSIWARHPASPSTRIGAELSFDLLEHPADIGFRARGATLEELFANSAHALLSIILDPSDIRPIQSISIPGTGADRESLLVNWLNEVYYVDGGRMALRTFDVVKFDETRVECVARGEPRDRDRHPSWLGVKAVTYHQPKVAQTAGDGSPKCMLISDGRDPFAANRRLPLSHSAR